MLGSGERGQSAGVVGGCGWHGGGREGGCAEKGRGGFTLVELLVSLAIMATLAGGLSLALATGLDADLRARSEDQQGREVRAILDVLRRDIYQAALTPNSARSWLIGSDEHDGARDRDTLRLTTRSRRVPLQTLQIFSSWEALPHDGDWSAVTYSLDPPVAGERRGLFRREQTPPGLDPFEDSGNEEALSEAVTGFNLRFFDGEEWTDSWDTTAGGWFPPPQAVEVTLVFGDGERRESEAPVTVAFPIRAVPVSVGEVGGVGDRSR